LGFEKNSTKKEKEKKDTQILKKEKTKEGREGERKKKTTYFCG
jgi:hypothetical protein